MVKRVLCISNCVLYALSFSNTKESGVVQTIDLQLSSTDSEKCAASEKCLNGDVQTCIGEECKVYNGCKCYCPGSKKACPSGTNFNNPLTGVNEWKCQCNCPTGWTVLNSDGISSGICHPTPAPTPCTGGWLECDL